MRFNLDMPAWKWPFYIMRHPFEGFEDLRWKKAYNMKVALVIVALLFIVSVCSELMTRLPVQHRSGKDLQHRSDHNPHNRNILHMGNRQLGAVHTVRRRGYHEEHLR